ncbi:ABC transporter substrate-binding protein [Xylophilus sp. GW821-FHT01B05]
MANISPFVRKLLATSLLVCAAPLWAQQPQRGGTLTLIGAEPPALLSLSNITVGARDISAKVTEGLLSYDDKFTPQPLLATRWSVSADGKRYRFELRQGVKWHDGQPFTSADVAYSLLELKRGNPRGRTTFAHLERVETPDAHTALLVLAAPSPYLLRALSAAESPIVPRHLYDKGDAGAAQNANAPVGTGPFRFKQWVRGAYAEFERNPDYWDSGKPYLDRLVYRFSADPAAIAAALETGSADFSTSVSLNDVARLQKHPRLQAEALRSAYLNNIAAIEFNLKNPFFAHPEVRRAVAHALDLGFINKVAYQQYAQPLASPIPPDMAPFHDPELKPYAYDVAAANALLDRAGFKRGPDGKRFAVTLDYFPTATLKLVAEYAKAALSRVGIHVTVRSQDLGGFIQRIYTQRDFDFEVNGVGTLFDPSVGVQRLYASTAAGKGIPFANAAGYQNPAVDTLLAQAATEQDEARRVALFRQFQKIAMDDLPLLPLVAVPRGNVWSKRVHGLFSGVEGSAGSLANAWVEAPKP